jgi:hypothetical protein
MIHRILDYIQNIQLHPEVRHGLLIQNILFHQRSGRILPLVEVEAGQSILDMVSPHLPDRYGEVVHPDINLRGIPDIQNIQSHRLYGLIHL